MHLIFFDIRQQADHWVATRTKDFGILMRMLAHLYNTLNLGRFYLC